MQKIVLGEVVITLGKEKWKRGFTLISNCQTFKSPSFQKSKHQQSNPARCALHSSPVVIVSVNY